MNILDAIKDYLKSPYPNEDGDDQGTKLLPGLTEKSIADYESQCGCTFTEEIRNLLLNCGGIEEGPMEIIEFKGEILELNCPLFTEQRVRQISPDGFGNFWFHWNPYINNELGPVFYYQHEGPMIFYQSDSIKDFILECIRFMTPPYESLIDDVHEFRIKPIKRLNDDLVSLQSYKSDSKTKDFISSLDEDTSIYDFKNSKTGDGIDLSKLEIVKIHPNLPVIAVKPKKSFLYRIFKK